MDHKLGWINWPPLRKCVSWLPALVWIKYRYIMHQLFKTPNCCLVVTWLFGDYLLSRSIIVDWARACPLRSVFKSSVKVSRGVGCHLPYEIKQSYLTTSTIQHTLLNASQTCLIYLPWRDGRLSCPRWPVTYQDGLPTHRPSPILVVTGPCVEQFYWAND